MARQGEFIFRTWGGRRRRAGRRAKGSRARLRHGRRPALAPRFPVHVTWRMRGDVPWLRSERCFHALARAFWGGCNRFAFRLVHYSVQGNHLHLLVEAPDGKALGRGMNGLGVRVARRLNRALGRTGRVLDERYHGHILTTPTETRRARAYLLQNAERHFGRHGEDPYASRWPLVQPESYLLRMVC